MAKRACKGKTKAGKACRAAPLADSDFCSAHDPERPDSIRFGSHEQATAAGMHGGRPRQPRAVEVMREKVEAEIELVLAPYFEALRGAMLHATYEGEVIVSEAPDLGARINAAERLLDRVYGRPRQRIEHGAHEDAPIPITFDKSLTEAAHDFLRRAARDRGA